MFYMYYFVAAVAEAGSKARGAMPSRRAELPPGVVGDVVDLDVGDGRSERAGDTAVDGLVLVRLPIGIHRPGLNPEPHPLVSDALADVVPGDPTPLLAIEGEDDVVVLHDDAVGVPATHVCVVEDPLVLLVPLLSGVTPVVGA